MSSRSKDTSRARTQAGGSRFERRSARNRTIILVMVVLMALSLVAVPLSLLFADDDAPTDDAGTAADANDDASAEPVATEGPCGPTPDDAPQPDSEVYDAPFEQTIDESATYVATIRTTCGDIVAELDAQGAPMATNNLVNLARDDYYTGVVFHRVVSGFVVQAGDPAGTGCGQADCEAFDPDAPTFPGYAFADELGPAEAAYEAVREEVVAELRSSADEAGEELDEEIVEMMPGGYPRGSLAMANAGPDTNGSQFFVAHGDPTGLPGPDFTLFGTVTEGMDVVDDIAASPTDEQGRPLEPVVILGVTVEQR